MKRSKSIAEICLISDSEESSEEEVIIVEDDEEVATKESAACGGQAGQPIFEREVNVPFDDYFKENEWWLKLLAPVPENCQCKIANCKVAPRGHEKHQYPRRNYAPFEHKIIIQYLVHYDKICNGKGYQVYEEMHEDGYMKHRPVQSLNNNFKRSLLRVIKSFKLPEHIEAQFLELIP